MDFEVMTLNEDDIKNIFISSPEKCLDEYYQCDSVETIVERSTYFNNIVIDSTIQYYLKITNECLHIDIDTIIYNIKIYAHHVISLGHLNYINSLFGVYPVFEEKYTMIPLVHQLLGPYFTLISIHRYLYSTENTDNPMSFYESDEAIYPIYTDQWKKRIIEVTLIESKNKLKKIIYNEDIEISTLYVYDSETIVLDPFKYCILLITPKYNLHMNSNADYSLYLESIKIYNENTEILIHPELLVDDIIKIYSICIKNNVNKLQKIWLDPIRDNVSRNCYYDNI